MRHISLKSAFARLSVTLMLLMGTISASAQYYLNVYEKSGYSSQYEVSNIDSISITDEQKEPVSYEYVDLGLSVNWATFNVGATVPEGFGNYYAWGEVQKKKSYNIYTYRWNNYIGQYATSILKPEDDVAHEIWGGDWRMPTKEEFQELIDNCIWQLTTINGIGGYRVTSRKDGYTERSIFLPLAGYYYNNALRMPWQKSNERYMGLGFYWSSSLYIDNNEPWYLWLLFENCNLTSNWPDKFQNDSINIMHGQTPWESVRNSSGFTIRPVQESAAWLNLFSVALDLESITMYVGDETDLTATLMAGSNEINRYVNWTSNYPSVVSVNDNGHIRAVSPGTAIVTASCYNKTATCKVTVSDKVYTIADVVRVTLDKKNVDLVNGENDTLSIRGFASDGMEIPLDGVVWKSDKPSVATVAGNGIINALNEGVAHISASVGSVSDTCTVTVTMKLADVGLYLGVMGFNIDIYSRPISILNSETKKTFGDFIKGMRLEDGTLLCYAVDNAIDALHSAAIPENLSTVAIVTFTDGLEDGSAKKINYRPYRNRNEYLDGIKTKISTDSIAGIPVTAYSIGLRGGDVMDTTLFKSSLKKIASSDSYAMEVKDMDEVDAKFEQIAGSLNRFINYQTVPIQITGTDLGARLRFTFDVDDIDPLSAASSSLYIEGTYDVEFDSDDNPSRYIFTDIEYHGMNCQSDSVVVGLEVGDYVKFTFEKVLKNDSTSLSKDKIKEWYLTTDSIWQVTSEFRPENQPAIETIKGSAIIMLVLDWSTSLKQDSAKIQERANKFINTLYNSYNSTSNGDDNGNGNGGEGNPPSSTYQYVDLGLSVKWATFNVGATAPEEYGDYYAWGETEPYYEAGYARENPQAHWKDGKSGGYSWSSYKYCKGDYDTMTKYCNKSSYGNNGYTDTKTTLDPEDDVAHVKWGGSWRMPTVNESIELLNNCTWTWTTVNGVNGYRVTSNKSGYTDRSIFLPAAGCRYDATLSNFRSYGYYWSSSLSTDDPDHARYLIFYSGSHYTNSSYRDRGRSVRPVCP